MRDAESEPVKRGPFQADNAAIKLDDEVAATGVGVIDAPVGRDGDGGARVP